MIPIELNGSGFLNFLRAASFRFYQEREWGLDIYLSGGWAWIPAALAVAAATVFLLAIFHLIPLRRHSVPVLLGIGLAAMACGVAGTYFKYRNVYLHPQDPPPRIFTQGSGAKPMSDGQKAALLCWPLALGAGAAGEGALGAFFLLVFGGRDPKRPSARGRGRDVEE